MTMTRGAKFSIAMGALAALLLWSRPVHAACGILGTNQTLYTNHSLYSCDGRFRLVMQGDGNLVVYEGNHALWANYKFGSNARLVMQGDGNLVVYDGANRPLWATYKFGSNAHLALQTDGNLVVYDGAGRVLWASMVYYREGQIQNLNLAPADQCLGRCGAGCSGWMPFGGGIYTSECRAHDECVGAHGNAYPECVIKFVPAAVSYLVEVGRNLINTVWDAITSIFHW